MFRALSIPIAPQTAGRGNDSGRADIVGATRESPARQRLARTTQAGVFDTAE